MPPSLDDFVLMKAGKAAWLCTFAAGDRERILWKGDARAAQDRRRGSSLRHEDAAKGSKNVSFGTFFFEENVIKRNQVEHTKTERNVLEAANSKRILYMILFMRRSPIRSS